MSGHPAWGSNIGGPAGATHVADMLCANASLTSLDLAGSALCGQRYGCGTYTSEGIKAIADALKGNAVLTPLNVELDSLGEEGEAVLRNAVKGRSGFKLQL